MDGVKGTVQIDVDDFLPTRNRLVLPITVRRIQAGAVNQNIDPPMAGKYVFGGFLHRVGIGNIQRLDFGYSAHVADFLRLGLQNILAPARHHHRHPRLRQSQRPGQPDSASSAGYPGYFSP